jgi:hypothetical protein
MDHQNIHKSVPCLQNEIQGDFEVSEKCSKCLSSRQPHLYCGGVSLNFQGKAIGDQRRQITGIVIARLSLLILSP